MSTTSEHLVAAETEDRVTFPWSGRRRAVVSVLLVLHIFAVFVAPWASPPPASELALTFARRLEPYLMAAHLNHGYRFFAPNPGPGHLVRYELTFPNGSQVLETHRFPDLQQQWPRLLYHRYFMISERVAAVLPPPPPGGFATKMEYRSYLDSTRENAEPLIRSIASHLSRRHGASCVQLYLQEHLIPSPQEVLEGMQLDDPRLYREQYLGELTDDGSWKWANRNPEPAEQVWP